MPAISLGMAVPLARQEQPGAFVSGMRLVAVDGMYLGLPDTPGNAAEFDYPGGGEGRGPFPQVRVVGSGSAGPGYPGCGSYLRERAQAPDSRPSGQRRPGRRGVASALRSGSVDRGAAALPELLPAPARTWCADAARAGASQGGWSRRGASASR